MKNIFFKIVLLLSIIFSYICTAQNITTLQYVNYYNRITPKLNVIRQNKTQYYNQNFSMFYNRLVSQNLSVGKIGIQNKMATSNDMYTLALYFEDFNMASFGIEKEFQCPVVYVTFVNEIPKQINAMLRQYEGNWNSNFANFFSNMTVESIEFVGVNGYNSSDRTPR